MNYDWESKTILIAEDEDTNFRYLIAALRKTKINILRAENGQEAIDILKENQVDAILLDIQMPILNGYEAAKIIKASNPFLPIIAQTAFAMHNERDRILEAGCDDYLAKPIRPKELLDSLSKFL